MPKPKKDKIDQLKDFVAKGFKQVDKRFEQVDKRFEQVDKRFEQVDKRFEQSDEKFNRQLAYMEKRFDQVDAKFKEQDKKFEVITGHLDHLYKKVEDLQQEYHMIVEGLRRIEDKLDNQDRKNVEIEKELKVLKNQVSILTDRINMVELSLKS